MAERTNWTRRDLVQLTDALGIANEVGFPPGAIWFVHNTGSSTNSGKSRDSAVATIAQAIAKAAANQGHVIYVMPGHTEDISTATSLVLNKAGVIILGGGQGRSRPVLLFTATAGSIELDAENCRLSNVVLKSSFGAVVVGINVDGDDIELDRLEFGYDGTGDDFITMVDVDGVDRTNIHNNRFLTEPATAGCAEAVRFDDNEQSRLVDNEFIGNFSDAAVVGEGAAGKDMVVARNTIYNSDTGAENGIDFAVATTGIAAHNDITTLYADPFTETFDPGSLLCIENYVCNNIDESGDRYPETTSN